MKLDQVNQTLEEALKFTRKERAMVQKQANNIILGIEYEFHVDDCEGGGDGETTEEFDEAVYERARELIEEVVEGKEKEFLEGVVEGDIQQYGSNCTESIENIIEKDGEMHNVEQVTIDVSVDQGVEVISNPLKLNDALDFMKYMFDHISEHGSTSSNTGMHVNMSIKGSTFDKEHFNVVKLLMLLDHKTLNDLFPVRGHIGRVIDDIGETRLVEMSLLSASDVLSSFGSMVDVDAKFQNVNFNHIDASNIDRRRIEFRFFGGDDYEQRYDVIENEIYRVAYALMVTFDEDFGEKEYLKAIVKELNLNVRRNKKMKTIGIHDFNDLRDYSRKLGARSSSNNDADIDMVLDNIEEDIVREKQR